VGGVVVAYADTTGGGGSDNAYATQSLYIKIYN